MTCFISHAIKITLTETDKSESHLSHLFGSPVLPASLLEAANQLDGDVLFFEQFDLSELAVLDVDNQLPHAGFLYLF